MKSKRMNQKKIPINEPANNEMSTLTKAMMMIMTRSLDVARKDNEGSELILLLLVVIKINNL